MSETITELATPARVSIIYDFVVHRCEIQRGYLTTRGEPEPLTMLEAIGKLAPSNTHSARINVTKLRRGDYIGVRKDNNANFVIRNPTSDGDIRWLLQRSPGFESYFREIYLVTDYMRRSAPTDVTVQYGLSQI